ncbi:hypothetical protein HDU76_009564, partial [Blyttiomyces sp. JEL0837]
MSTSRTNIIVPLTVEDTTYQRPNHRRDRENMNPHIHMLQPMVPIKTRNANPDCEHHIHAPPYRCNDIFVRSRDCDYDGEKQEDRGIKPMCQVGLFRAKVPQVQHRGYQNDDER